MATAKKVSKPKTVKAAPRPAAVAIDYDKIAAAVVRALPAAAPQEAFDYDRVTDSVKRGLPTPKAVNMANVMTYATFGAVVLTMGLWLATPKPVAVAAPLPVAPITVAAPTIDYARIAAEVKAALPVPAAPKTVVKTVTKTVVKRAAPRFVYVVPHYGCGC